MTKRKKSLTALEKAKPTREALLTERCALPETLIYMRQCEAREWLKRYRAKARENGALDAMNWWRKTVADIERIRGIDATIELRNLMNIERKK